MRIMLLFLIIIGMTELSGCAKHNLKKEIALMYRTGDTFEQICQRDEKWKDWGSMENCVREAEYQAPRIEAQKQRGYNFSGVADGVTESNKRTKSFGEFYLGK